MPELLAPHAELASSPRSFECTPGLSSLVAALRAAGFRADVSQHSYNARPFTDDGKVGPFRAVHYLSVSWERR